MAALACLMLVLTSAPVMASGEVMPLAMMGQTMASHASGPDADGMSMVHAAMRHGHAPSTPMGHGDCCRGSCHCLSACNAALAVPRLVAVETFARASLPTTATVDTVRAPMTPPLRPPIA